ncbi:PAS domain S-box protein [Sulfuricurvum sp.]|uniref:PAS domain S-box protein n=1 Tax=Sulfuricurvum sp. TaxID=2025608 RepID=UPI002D35D1B2|nr:PAS domain S-box protein [Sulfuricurvum sp.]HZF71174.1 PAS domain S-box protein [Sulfuricurvum sp.]
MRIIFLFPTILAAEDFHFSINEVNLFLIILSVISMFLAFFLMYKIKVLKEKHTRMLKEYETDSKILFMKLKYASMGETVGNIAHQWKQPLNAIGTIQNSIKAALIFQGEISKEKLLYSVDTSFKLLQHLAATIDTFYSFLSQENNENRSFLIADAFETIRKITEYSFENSRITLLFELHSNPTIMGNANEFTHAMLNLILNAKDALDDFQPDNPLITLTVTGGETMCVITVTDNAGGIRIEPISSIFQWHNSSKKEGSGIGLYMTKNIIEKRFSGTINVENNECGASFTIKLPYAADGEEPSQYYDLEKAHDFEHIKQLTKKIIELEELEKTLKKFAINHIHEAVFLINENARFEYVNDEACRSLGYSKNELLTMSLEEIDPDWPTDKWHIQWKKIQEEKSLLIETTHIRKDGSTFPIEVSVNYFENEGVGYNLTICRNITERKESEQQVKLLETAINHANEAVYIIGDDRSIVYVSDTACRMLGYTREEFMEMKVYDIDVGMTKEDIDFVKEKISLNDKILFETRHKTKEGHVLDVEITVTSFNYNDVALRLSIVKDISERKNVEEALRQSEETFRAMVENSPDVIMRYDLECRRTYVNPMAQILMGKPVEEILGKTPREYSPLPESTEFEKHFFRVVTEGKELELESPYRTAFGEIRVGSQRIIPEFDTEGKVGSVMVIGRDITERKQAEKQLKLLETAINHANDAVYILGDDRSILYVSDAACRMLGYTHDEFLNMKIEEIDTYLSTDEINTIQENMQTKQNMTFETKHRAKDGHILDVVIAVTMFDYDDTSLRISIVKDITVR